MGGSQWKTKPVKDQHNILELYLGTLLGHREGDLLQTLDGSEVRKLTLDLEALHSIPYHATDFLGETVVNSFYFCLEFNSSHAKLRILTLPQHIPLRIFII